MDTIQTGYSVQLHVQKLTYLLQRAHIAWNNNVLLLKKLNDNLILPVIKL